MAGVATQPIDELLRGLSMKKFLLSTLVLLVLAVVAFFVFYEADPPPAPLVPAPANPLAALELQSVIDANYCGEAQQILAQTDVAVVNEIHLNFDSFVKSKPSTNPLTTHQFLHYVPVEIAGEELAFPAIVSCKLKTAERINEQDGNSQAGPDIACKNLLQRDVNAVLAELDDESLVFDPADIVYADDEMANQGRTWLAPWPYAVARKANGTLVWQSKAMLISYDWYNPMPARFLGTHYCHLPTPQYIRGVLTGEIQTLLAPVAIAE